jgi:hypothetical protein
MGNPQNILSCTKTEVYRMMALDPNKMRLAQMQQDKGKLQQISSC